MIEKTVADYNARFNKADTTEILTYFLKNIRAR